MLYTWSAIFLSLFSPWFYRKVARRKKGCGLKFIALIALVEAVVSVVAVVIYFNVIDQYEEGGFFRQVEEIRMNNGHFSIGNSSPYIVRENNKPIGVVDTYSPLVNDEVAFSAMKKEDLRFIITQTHIYMRWEGDYESFKIPNFGIKFQVPTKQIKDFTMSCLTLGLPALVAILFISYFFYRLIQVVLLSLIGVIFKLNSSNSELDFPDIMRLAAYAVWPAVLLDIIFRLYDKEMTIIASLPLMIFYLYFAVKTAKPVVKA